MKVLVTGGCGFVGSHIVDVLIRNGHKVAVVDNLSTGKLDNLKHCKNEFAFYQVDLLSTELEDVFIKFKPEYIIHQAAQVSVAESVSNLGHDAKVNILGSIRLIELAQKYKVKKIIYSSSAAVYGNPTVLPITPDISPHPMSPYGISKYVVEHYLNVSYLLFCIDYTILRYANVYGPRQNHKGEGGVVSRFANDLLHQRNLTIYGDGLQTRDFVYVEDVAEANAAALFHGSQQTVNVSSGIETTILDLASILGKSVRETIQYDYKPERKADIKSSVLCNKKTLDILNWKPSTSLESGLEKTMQFYKKSI